jgi:hypothetical protein
LIGDARNPLFVTRSDADVLRARISLIRDGYRGRQELLIQSSRELRRSFAVTARTISRNEALWAFAVLMTQQEVA